MTGSNWPVEEYSAWRRERVEEAAQLARYVSYSDLAGWGKGHDLRALRGQGRGDDGGPGIVARLGQALHVAWAALFQLALG